MLNHRINRCAGSLNGAVAKVRCLLLAMLTAAAFLAVTGCGMRDEDAVSPQPVDDGVSDPAQSDIPEPDGSASYQVIAAEFRLQEDQSVSATLSLSTTDDVEFSLLSGVEYGDLQLSKNGTFVYQPQADFAGDDAFEVFAWNEQGASSPVSIKLHIEAVPDAPEIAGDTITVIEQGARYEVRYSAIDADGDLVRFEGSNLPEWLSLNASTGVLSGVPNQSDIGLHEAIVITAVDASGLAASLAPFSIEVLDINDPPFINASQFPLSLDARQRVQVQVFPDDPDGDAVTLTTELNDFVDVTIQGGSMEVTAKDVVEVTEINLVVIAEDRLGRVSREVLPITLYPLTASGAGRTVQGRRFGAGVHLVVLGDGYKADQQDLYNRNVQRFIDLMASDPAIERHLSAWNIHTIEAISVDSGIDDNVLEDVRDTAFNAGYSCLGVPRLICADEIAVFRTALADYPHVDQIVLLINDQRYGGSGGAVAIASASSMEVALHELGHSFAELADEYEDALAENVITAFQEGQYANVSTFNLPDRVPWSQWINDPNNYPTEVGQPGVGIFEGAFYRNSGFYRPTATSRMRDVDQPLGPVNGEQWAISVYRVAHPVRDFGPARSELTSQAGEILEFFVAPLFDDSVQRISWSLNGVLLQTSSDNETLAIMPPAGQHRLELTVADITGTIRREPPHEALFSWAWELDVR